ncbi:nucleoside triphosphate pyrophosphohydrolase [Thioflexithrix psekupsensis]|uniref:Nucleoside triphosphate pyrophosphohydrolase n=1 Tax=Thioflexithrix psekupsensis TaxID=1570016 RepID=A0A251XBN2_9GAMM|nr:nucleoside triphosphate pyrophosphohydrolase [Thioflexithrix psekupsensis]OUD16060.1 nucleoside triphosphate pyrophosphohydrolase [Thioflexithrix psekupsensis]
MTENVNHSQTALLRLLQIMDELRANCPWDRKQTMASLRHLTLEETYELSDAILTEDLNAIKVELGDLLLHIMFYAKIASEQEAFNFADIANSLCDKLIRRHPHVYGDEKTDNEQLIKQRWEVQKLSEQPEGKRSALAGVPRSLPPLLKALRIQEKARGVGFDWENKTQVWDKVQEELSELNHAVILDDSEAILDEFGDVLFSLVNYARFLDINPETALERTNRKFISRFQALEQAVQADGLLIHDLSLEKLEQYWQAAKLLEQQEKSDY